MVRIFITDLLYFKKIYLSSDFLLSVYIYPIYNKSVVRDDLKAKASSGCEPTEPLLKTNAIAHAGLDNQPVSLIAVKGKDSRDGPTKPLDRFSQDVPH